MLRSTDRSWGTPAKLLHWVVAALVLAQIAAGWAAVAWPMSPTKIDLFVVHKSIGMLLLLLMVLRAMWRAVDTAPTLPSGMGLLERRAAQASHLLLYLLLLVIPVTGWIVTSAANIPFRVFWVLPVPTIVEPDKAIADVAASWHLGLVVTLSLLLAVHVGAALRHHFLKHDDVLVRMLPGTGGAK